MGDDLEDPYAMTRGRYFTASALGYFSVQETRVVLERAAALAEKPTTITSAPPHCIGSAPS